MRKVHLWISATGASVKSQTPPSLSGPECMLLVVFAAPVVPGLATRGSLTRSAWVGCGWSPGLIVSWRLGPGGGDVEVVAY